MKTKYLTSENKTTFALLMLSGGMMGAYTFNLRGGVFSNAQTANIVLMSIAFGHGEFFAGLYYLIPITAYSLGAFISELFLFSSKKVGYLKWDTILLLIEAIILFIIGFIPLTWSHHIVQILINFIAAMQFNTFKKARGIPMSTTFCTNHVRQLGVVLAQVLETKNWEILQRLFVHLGMIVSFLVGGIVLTFFVQYFMEKSIWLACIPLLICFINLVYTDKIESEKEITLV